MGQYEDEMERLRKLKAQGLGANGYPLGDPRNHREGWDKTYEDTRSIPLEETQAAYAQAAIRRSEISPVPATSVTSQQSQFTPLIGDYTPPPIVGPPPELAVAGPPHIPAQEIAQAWENLYYDFPSDGLKNRVLEAQEWAKRKKREWEW